MWISGLPKEVSIAYAHLKSEVCLFLKEIKSRALEPQFLGTIQVVPQGMTRHWVLSSFNCLSTMVVKAGIITGDTVWKPSLASWFFGYEICTGEKSYLFPLAQLNWILCLQPRRGLCCGTCRRPKLARKQF